MTTLRHIFSLCLLGFALLSPALAQIDPADERARIAQEKSAADQRLLEQEKACESRFAVTSCVEAARKQHREAVAPLRQQEFLLNAAQRQQRAAQRRVELQEKAAAQTKRDMAQPVTPPTSVDDSASASKNPQPPSRVVASPEQQAKMERQHAQKQAQARAEADKRVKLQQEKLAIAQRRKAQVEKRNADKAASGKPPPTALKTPPASNP